MHWQKECNKVFVAPSLIHYIIAITRATRNHPRLELGASPRASLALYRTSCALALLRGRNYVLPDDIKYLTKFVLAHRLIPAREERLRGYTCPKDNIKACSDLITF